MEWSMLIIWLWHKEGNINEAIMETELDNTTSRNAINKANNALKTINLYQHIGKSLKSKFERI